MPQAAQRVAVQGLVVVKALQGQGPLRLLWVTRSTVAVQAGEGVRAEMSPMWGQGRTVMQEHPELGCRLVDLEAGAEDLGLVEQELGAEDEESQVAWRGGVRHVARLVRVKGRGAEGGLQVPRSGTVLITGGLGAIGLHVARWLVQKGVRHVVLMSRRGQPSAGSAEVIKELQERGTRGTVAGVDVGDRAGVEATLKGIGEEEPALDLGAVRGGMWGRQKAVWQELLGKEEVREGGKGDGEEWVERVLRLEPAERERQVREAVQKEVARVLSLSGGSVVAVDRPLSEVGLDSLMALELRNGLGERMGMSLPATLTFDHPTVNALTRRLLDAILVKNEPSYTPLVALRTSGSGSPFFCAHPIGGSAFAYRELAMYLGEQQPLYAFHAAGVDTNEPAHTDLPNMADRYVKAMREVQPNGPYHVGGWSFGGLVAYEMAQQLAAAGFPVANLIMIDTWLYPSMMMQGAADRDLHEQLLMMLLAGELGLPFDDSLLAQEPADAALSRVAAFATEKGALLKGLGEEYLSSLAAGPMDIQFVPGDHFSMVREPLIRDVAKAVQKALATITL